MRFLLIIFILFLALNGDDYEILNKDGGDKLFTQVANKDFLIKIDNESGDKNKVMLILKDENDEYIGCKKINLEEGVNDISIDENFIYQDKANYVTKNVKFYLYAKQSSNPIGMILCPLLTSISGCDNLSNYEIGSNISGCEKVESDEFAIRPDKFELSVKIDKIKAGNEFNVTVKALDAKGNVVQNYDENLTIRDDSPLFDYKEVKDNCKTGNLEFAENADTELKNEVNTTLVYNEIGEIELNLSEKVGSEFAKIDKDDTNVSQRLITPAKIYIKFYPDHFSFNAKKDNKSFTYISNDLNMSSKIDINITAENESNNTTENYNKECYAQDFNLTFTHTNSDLNISYKELNDTLYNIKGDENITLNLSKDYFSTDYNGTALLEILFNLNKNYSKPVNPIDFTINDVNFSDSNISLTAPLNLTYKFLYGRLKIKDAVGYGNKVFTNAKYLYWKDGWIINSNHSKEYGDINLSESVAKKIDIELSDIEKGAEDINYTTSYILPYGSVIHFGAPSWLFYNPLATKYISPKESKECLTHICARVTFLKSSESWGGIQSKSEKYSDENRSVELVPYKSDENVSKKEVKRINW